MKINISPLTKKISLTLAVIFFIFSAGLFYVNKILLPIQVRAMAIKAAQEALKRNVTFDTLQYSPLRGFVITDVVISEKNAPERVFFRAKEISAQVLFFALLQKKLIIPSLRIESPEATLTRSGKDAWNFSDLIAPAAPEAKPSADMDIIVSGLSIMSGQIQLNDTSTAEPFSETINIPLIKGSLSFNGAFNIAGNITLPSSNGTLEFDTRTGIKDRSFKGSFNIKNIPASRFLRFSPAPLPIAINNLNITTAEITALVQKDRINISGDINLPGLDIATTDGTILKTDLTLTKIFANLIGTDITLQCMVHAGKLALTTASGLNAHFNALRADNLNIAAKKNNLSITSDLDIQGLDAGLNAGQAIKGNINTRAISVTQDLKGFHVTTDLSIQNLAAVLGKDQTLSGNVLLDRMTATVNGTNIQAKSNIAIADVKLAMPDMTLTADITAPETQMTLDTGRIDATLRATFKKLAVKSKDITITGTPQLNARISFEPNAKTPLTYTGTLAPIGVAISGIPSVGEIRDIEGNITLETGRAAAKDLFFHALNIPVQVSGELTNMEAPQLSVTAKANAIDLAVIEKFIPDIVKEQGLKISGTADANIQFTGALNAPQDAKVVASAQLKDAAFESKKMNQRASAINGRIEYSAPSLSWKDLSIRYMDKTWVSHGYLQDFVNPFIVASIRTDNLTANIQARKKNDTFDIDELTGTWFDSNFNIKGKAFLPQGQPPAIELNNEVKLSLRDLPKMLPPEQAKQIDALKLAGILKIKANVKGTPQDWQDLVSTVSIATPAFYIMGYQIADLDVKTEQKNGTIDPVTVKGTLYNGALTAEGAVDLKSKNMPFTAKLKIDNTSLEQFKKDTPLKNQQMSGTFSATADAKGALLNIRTLTGNASIKIANGYLWELEILSRVLSILSTTFQGGDVIITDADATFKITDQKIMTNDLTLRSATVTLTGEGWVDFDQNIEMNISPRLEPKTASGTTNPLEAINLTAGIVNIRIYNTLTAPKFEHNISTPQVIKKTLQNTVGSILKLFE